MRPWSWRPGEAVVQHENYKTPDIFIWDSLALNIRECCYTERFDSVERGQPQLNIGWCTHNNKPNINIYDPHKQNRTRGGLPRICSKQTVSRDTSVLLVFANTRLLISLV